MATYLLTWNPDRWPWASVAADVERVAKGKATIRWSTGNTKTILPGDEIFLLQQGSQGRGIIGSGIASSAVFADTHFEKERATLGELANYVEVDFDRLIDPAATPEMRLDVDALRAEVLNKVNWGTQSSGIKIPPEAVTHLRRMWFERTGGIPEGITRDDIIGAVKDLRGGASHAFGDSTKYHVLFEGQGFSPKAVIGLAARRVAGRVLTPYDFRGGDESKSFRVLRDAGLEVTKISADPIRNPDWARDELILALDLYFRLPPAQASADSPEIQKLSAILNELPIHPRRLHGEAFRNPNGVYMKLCNFLRFDPSYAGKGLQRGNKLESAVWEEFSGDRVRLRQTADAIIENSKLVAPASVYSGRLVDEEEEFSEGQVLTVVHQQRERNSKAAKQKKAQALALKGALICEVCDFNFCIVYGIIGKDFAECHHRKPLSALRAQQPTKLKDLAIVCANCHRMLHKGKPWKTVEELSEIVRANLKPLTTLK